MGPGRCVGRHACLPERSSENRPTVIPTHTYQGCVVEAWTQEEPRERGLKDTQAPLDAYDGLLSKFDDFHMTG
jgi:hypothetical protein